MQPYLEISFDKTTTVNTTSKIVLPPNRNRSSALLINDSDTVIYLMKGKVAVAHRGIRLNASGGSYEINSTNLYKGEIASKVAVGSGKVLLINEDEAKYL